LNIPSSFQFSAGSGGSASASALGSSGGAAGYGTGLNTFTGQIILSNGGGGGGGGGGLFGGGGGGGGGGYLGGGGGGGGGSNLVPAGGSQSVDNTGVPMVQISYVLVPTSIAQCKNGGWRNYGSMFKNQGQCVAFVERTTRHATISRVTFRGGPISPEVIISGRDFGRRPAPDPAGGTSKLGQCGAIPGRTGHDFGSKLWLGNRTRLWSAGYTPYGDCMGLILTKYTNREIVYRLGSFYALHYPLYKLAQGDSVDINVNGAVLTTRVEYAAPDRRHH
jgi:hypothetical protein